MSDNDTKPQGIVVTIREMYDMLVKLDNRLDGELANLKAQVSAMWVVHGIMLGVITFLITKGLDNV